MKKRFILYTFIVLIAVLFLCIPNEKSSESAVNTEEISTEG